MSIPREYHMAAMALETLWPKLTPSKLQEIVEAAQSGTQQEPDRLLKTSEAAKRLGLSKDKLFRMMRDGQIPKRTITQGHRAFRGGKHVIIGGLVGVPESAIKKIIAQGVA